MGSIANGRPKGSAAARAKGLKERHASRRKFARPDKAIERSSRVYMFDINGLLESTRKDSQSSAALSAGRSGKRLFFDKTVAGTTMGYPSSDSAANYLTLTARPASWCAHSANKLIDHLREVPFSDKELRMLTGGRIKTADDIYVDAELQPGKRHGRRALGRNHPCPCGSGKKYKHCCWKELA
jgi:SEC-C motif